MSAFSTVVTDTEEICPHCQASIRRRAQFKYGDARSHDYMLGDSIIWGGADIGSPAALVRVLGHLEECPVCGYDIGGLVELVVRNGTIELLVPGDSRPYVAADHATFLVLEP